MSRYLKALAAALTAFGGALGTALTNDAVTSQEWIAVAVATVVAAAAVYQTPNAPDVPGEHEA